MLFCHGDVVMETAMPAVLTAFNSSAPAGGRSAK
jgi:hypothetical protein